MKATKRKINNNSTIKQSLPIILVKVVWWSSFWILRSEVREEWGLRRVLKNCQGLEGVQGLRDWQPEKRVPGAYAGRGLGTNEPHEFFFVVTVTVLNNVSRNVLNYVDCFIFM